MAGRSIGWPAGFWLTVCAGLAAIVAYQLSNSFPLAPTVTAAPPGAAMLDLPERPALPRSPDDAALDQIAARPLFSESRRPYVAPAAPVEEALPEPVEASLLELAGTFLRGTDQAALILVSGRAPAWLRKGQLIEGWRVEAVEQDRVRLRKGDREQILQLRDDIAALKPTGPTAERRAGPAADPADEDGAPQE